MRDPLSKQIRGIKPSGIRKFFDVVNEMPDAISLGVGEPDFDTPWHIRDEGIYSLEKGRTFYTSNSGLKELKIEICNYLKRSQNLDYDYNKQVIVTVGGSEAIDIALRAMLDPGDEVLIPQPCYVSYDPCTILAGGVPVPINLKHENEFRLTPQELKAAITPKTKVLIMAAFKIIVLTVFIMVSIILVVDGIFIGMAFRNAVKNKIKYEKALGFEMIALLIWSFCLSCLILL